MSRNPAHSYPTVLLYNRHTQQMLKSLSQKRYWKNDPHDLLCHLDRKLIPKHSYVHPCKGEYKYEKSFEKASIDRASKRIRTDLHDCRPLFTACLMSNMDYHEIFRELENDRKTGKPIVNASLQDRRKKIPRIIYEDIFHCLRHRTQHRPSLLSLKSTATSLT